MKHLILGSSGQIGSALCKYIKNYTEDSYIEFDILNGYEQSLFWQDNPFLNQSLEECDFVHFLAFDVGGSRYLKKYEKTFDFVNNNLQILTNGFSAIKKYGKPFIFASSQMANMLHSPYGMLKCLGEKLTESLNGLNVKFWNVYDIEHDPRKAHVITDLVMKGIRTGKIDLLTSGREKRQFLHGEDAAKCLINLSKVYKTIDRAKNLHITSFKWYSILEIAEIIRNKLNLGPIIASQEEDSVQQGMANEPDPYILKFWEPKISIEEGIDRIINYYKKG